MSDDEYDILPHLKKEKKNNISLDVIKGLNARTYGHFKNNIKAKENVKQYAEEELVRKKEFSELRCEMPGQPRSTFLMVFSPDGTMVASTHGNHNIYVTDIRSGKNIRTLVGHPRTPWCIAFHPTSNQIVASGCLGGQVRIWDLSGGSEVWTTGTQSVIASIAFHPNDRVLVIATFNEVIFWDWSKPEPFVHCATSNPKEKVRYVAFDKLGHKLITGIANSPQTRWERARAPVPVPRQAERCASPYRRRITPRLVNLQTQVPTTQPEQSPTPREVMSGVPERERRITLCYRNLVREYEQLVHRYLQLYRPPTMIDRGTDPMEPSAISTNSGTQTPGTSTDLNQPSTSSQAPTTTRNCDCKNENNQRYQDSEPGPSRVSSEPTMSSQNLISPSKIFSIIRGTQTSESRKHKNDSSESESPPDSKAKRQKSEQDGSSSSSEVSAATPEASSQQSDMGTQTQSPRKVLIINTSTLRSPEPSTSGLNVDQPSTSGFRIRCPKWEDKKGKKRHENRRRSPGGSGSGSAAATAASISDTVIQNNVDEFLSNIRRTAEEEVRSRILPIIRSVPETDRPELIRLFENSREHVRMRLRQMYPSLKKTNRRPLPTNTSSENNSSSDDEPSTGRSPPRVPETASTSGSSNMNQISESTSNSTNPLTVRNFNTELEQLVTSLLTEIERNQTERTTANERIVASSSNSPTIETTTNQSVTTTTPSSIANFIMSISQLYSNEPTTTSVTSSSFNTSALHRRCSLRNLHWLNLYRSLESVGSTSLDSVIPNVPTTTASVATPCPSTIVNTNTSTTNSTIYTSNSEMQRSSRRRFFTNRVSAFMPTRVNWSNYIRTPARLRRTYCWGRGRVGCRYPPSGNNAFALDELINYSERANSEDDPPSSSQNLDELDSSSELNHETRIRNMYSGIVQDLESSLNDVENIRASNRPGETSDMLNSFSERLENIMTQSESILRNLRSSMDVLSATTEPGSSRTDPAWHLYDNFYVRDHRADGNPDASESGSFSDPYNTRVFNAIATDHTYPRNPDAPSTSTSNESMSPLMTSLHLTITHIQRQARLLRQQVESIERIDRAMIEVAQLQLFRHIVLRMVRQFRLLTGERVVNNAGMTSVRQMMEGTRISDNSPYDSPVEDNNVPSSSQTQSNSRTGTTNNTPSGTQRNTLVDISLTETPHPSQLLRSRGSNRKTYPPSRYLRWQRQCRRPIVHFLSRRHLNRNDRHRTSIPRPSGTRTPDSTNPYSTINSTTLGFMIVRLRRLLTEQLRFFTSPQESQPPNRSTATIDLGEHLLGLRLQGCVLRMDRILGRVSTGSSVNSVFVDPSTAVTQDGVSRYNARFALSLIVDGMSRYMEELGNTSAVSPTMRLEIHSVLAMSLLLSELLLLQVVDSIPPPSGMNLDPERESLTARIDQMCGQMLQSRWGQSHQLTRSLRLMRLTMRQAYQALGQTYNARRNAIQPRTDSDRRQLFEYTNRCLRTIQRAAMRRRQGATEQNSNENNSSDTVNDQETNNQDLSGVSNDNNDSGAARVSGRQWYSTVDDVLSRLSHINEDDSNNSRGRDSSQRPGDGNSSNNSDDNDDESEWYGNNNSSSHNSNLYRTNNVNLVQSDSNQTRPWNIPSMLVNDVPVTEGEVHHRFVSNSRFATRMMERSSDPPSIGLFRPRFLYPMYPNVNPFDADLDDPQRESEMYNSDMITTVTPNHRIQAWDISDWEVPTINNSMKNVVVGECKIHNDASVDVAKDGTLLVTLLPSGGYLNVTNRLGVYSLRWETLGQCLYTTSFEQNAVSVSLSPLSRHLVVGLASRRVSIVPSDRWVMARIFKIDQKDVPGDRLPMLRELEQNRDNRINCIRWLPSSGQGMIYATNTGQLVILS